VDSAYIYTYIIEQQEYDHFQYDYAVFGRGALDGNKDIDLVYSYAKVIYQQARRDYPNKPIKQEITYD